jgi:hypothetical protein
MRRSQTLSARASQFAPTTPRGAPSGSMSTRRSQDYAGTTSWWFVASPPPCALPHSLAR